MSKAYESPPELILDATGKALMTNEVVRITTPAKAEHADQIAVLLGRDLNNRAIIQFTGHDEPITYDPAALTVTGVWCGPSAAA